MATPRSRLIDDELPLFYHLVSRCVRRSFLCGWDKSTRRSFDHRKSWLIKRLRHLGRYFAIEVHGYAIMSNHFHLVVFYDPTAAGSWSDEEVADRWLGAFPRKNESAQDRDFRRELILTDPSTVSRYRKTLGSISAFMKHLKQPIAVEANKEDKCGGHFFEGRFYSGALLSEEAAIAAMAYVDLNPVRAKISKSIRQITHCSISERLRKHANTKDRLREALKPLVSGLANKDRTLTFTLKDYLEALKSLVAGITASPGSDKVHTWHARVAAIRERRRAFGSESEIADFSQRRGLKRRDPPLPELC